MRAETLLAILAVTSCLAGCKKDETEPAPTIAVPPAATVPAQPTGPVAAPPPVVAPPPIAPAPVQPPATKPATTDAGVPPVDAGKPPATDAGTGTGAGANKLQECVTKCQGILQNCLTPTFPPDGGFPQPKDPKLCQDAFTACSKACTP